MSIEVSKEEYQAEIEHRDWLLYRIRLDVNRIKHWEGILKSTQIWADRLKRHYKDLYTKYAEPELKEITEKLEYWKQQREEHFKQVKTEHERIKRKKIVELIKIVEVTAYLNYIPRSLGGKGRTNEYKVIRWVREGEEDSPDTEEKTYDLWSRVYFWFRPMLEALKDLHEGSLQYGITNRIDWVAPNKISSVKDWLHCLMINPNTHKVAFQGTANITRLSNLCRERVAKRLIVTIEECDEEQAIADGDGYNLVSPRNNIFYHNCPSPYTGDKP